MQEIVPITIENLDLTRRTYHALVRGGVLTISDLRQFYENRDRHQIRNIGQESLNEISKVLQDFPNDSSLLPHAEKDSSPQRVHDNASAEKEIQSPIDILALSASIRGKLKKHGIRTVDDLRKAPDSILLNINLIGPKKLTEIRLLLDNFIDNSKTTVTDKPVSIVEKRPLTWAEIIEDYFRDEKDVYSYILISRFGFYPKTLEEIAAELNVTRERIRQIQEAVAVRYLNYIRFSGAIGFLERVEDVFSRQGDGLSLSSLKTILKREGVLGQFSDPVKTKHIRNLDLLETMICWLNLISNKKYTLQPIEFSVDISDLTKSGKISIRDRTTLMNISKRERRKIRRKVLFTGGITIHEASKILSKDERITVLVLKDLNFQKIDDQWFTYKSLTEDKDNSKIPLRIAGLKILAVHPVMAIESFHDGLRRHASRFYASIAPIHVIEHISTLLGFDIKNNEVSTQLSTKGILSKSEQSLISAIKKNGDVASFLEIAEEFFLQNLSLPAVSVTLKRSPIVEKVNEGFYKLRGSEISWQNIETAKNRQKRFAQNDEITHGLDGIVRMKFTVNSYAYLTGVVGAWSVKDLSGSWTVIYDGGPFSDAKIDESYLWGLAKILKLMEVKMGERMELAFNTWNRTLSARKVKNENS